MTDSPILLKTIKLVLSPATTMDLKKRTDLICGLMGMTVSIGDDTLAEIALTAFASLKDPYVCTSRPTSISLT
jgi:hypothetical protein